MKTLVLYYSFEGNTDRVARILAEAIGAEMERIVPVNELRSRGFSKFVWGGKQAVMKEKPPIQPMNNAFDDFDYLVIGTPVWAGTYAPPLRTVFETIGVKDKNVGLFITHQGGARNALSNMRGALTNCQILGEASLPNPEEMSDKDILGQLEGIMKPAKG